VIESLTVGIETEPQNAEAVQRIAPVLLPEFCHLLARGEANLDGANELGRVVGMNLLRRGVIQAPQNAMKINGAAALCSFAQPLAQFFRALGAGEKSFEQGAQVESGSAHNNRQMAARLDFLQHLPRLAGD